MLRFITVVQSLYRSESRINRNQNVNSLPVSNILSFLQWPELPKSGSDQQAAYPADVETISLVRVQRIAEKDKTPKRLKRYKFKPNNQEKRVATRVVLRDFKPRVLDR